MWIYQFECAAISLVYMTELFSSERITRSLVITAINILSIYYLTSHSHGYWLFEETQVAESLMRIGNWITSRTRQRKHMP